MDAVSQHVAHGGPVSQNNPEIPVRPYGSCNNLLRSFLLNHKSKDNDRRQGAKRQQHGHPAPVEPGRNPPGQEHGERRADPVGRGVKCYRPALPLPVMCSLRAFTPGMYVPARLIPARSRKNRCRECFLGEPSEADHGSCTDGSREDINAAGIKPVGKADEDGGKNGISPIKYTVDPACFGIGEVPFRLKSGQKGGKKHGAGHGKYLGGADGYDKCNLTGHPEDTQPPLSSFP